MTYFLLAEKPDNRSSTDLGAIFNDGRRAFQDNVHMWKNPWNQETQWDAFCSWRDGWLTESRLS